MRGMKWRCGGERKTEKQSERKREKKRVTRALGKGFDTLTEVIKLRLSLQNSSLKVQHNYKCSDQRKESFRASPSPSTSLSICFFWFWHQLNLWRSERGSAGARCTLRETRMKANTKDRSRTTEVFRRQKKKINKNMHTFDSRPSLRLCCC